MIAELVVDCKNHHGEGVVWNSADQRIWWTDIEGRSIWSFKPGTGEHAQYDLDDRVCCFAPRRSGGLIVGFADRISLFDLDSRQEQIIERFEPDNPATRVNDGCTDRQGRLVVGGMNEANGAADSSVYRVDADLSVNEIISGVACANSTCFSPDGKTLFFADTPDNEIVAYDYNDQSGTVSNRRVHCSFTSEPGLPDGSCVDAEGGVWNAEWEGRRVVRINREGVIDQIIEVPVWKPTCCAFGGPELDTLYITTSRFLSDEQAIANEPLSGGLFAVKPGPRGVLDAPFGG